MPDNNEYFTADNWGQSPFFSYYHTINQPISSIGIDGFFKRKDNFNRVFKLWLHEELERWKKDGIGEVTKAFDILRDETFISVTPDEVFEIPAAEIVTWLNSYGDAIIENSYQNVKAEIETFSLPLSEVNTQDGHRNYLKSSGFKSMEVLNQGLNVLNTALARRKKAILSRQLQQENFKIINSTLTYFWLVFV